jgi:hypothetical protein
MFELIKTKWGNIAQGDMVLLPNQHGKAEMWQVTRFTTHDVPGVCEGENFLYTYYLENLMHGTPADPKVVTVDIDRYYVQVIRNG